MLGEYSSYYCYQNFMPLNKSDSKHLRFTPGDQIFIGSYRYMEGTLGLVISVRYTGNEELIRILWAK